jgi:hypothetical protein
MEAKEQERWGIRGAIGETGAEVAGEDACDPNDMDIVDRFVVADEGEEALR